jgi:hypothetical protein
MNEDKFYEVTETRTISVMANSAADAAALAQEVFAGEERSKPGQVFQSPRIISLDVRREQ